MPYYRPRNPAPPQQNPSQAIDESPGIGDVVDVGKGGLAGFMHGLTGKNTTYEQWIRDQKRKKRGFPNQSRQNWLQRLIAPK